MSLERDFMTMLGSARVMQQMLNSAGSVARPSSSGWSPPTDVFETDDAVVVKMEVPHVSRPDLRIQICPTAICVQGRRVDGERGAKTRVLQMEINYGAFHRIVDLPVPIRVRQARARYDGAMLEVVLPKAVRRPKVGMIVTIEL